MKNLRENMYELAARGMGMMTEMVRIMAAEAQNALRTSAKVTCWIEAVSASLVVAETVVSLTGNFLSSS